MHKGLPAYVHRSSSYTQPHLEKGYDHFCSLLLQLLLLGSVLSHILTTWMPSFWAGVRGWKVLYHLLHLLGSTSPTQGLAASPGAVSSLISLIALLRGQDLPPDHHDLCNLEPTAREAFTATSGQTNTWKTPRRGT